MSKTINKKTHLKLILALFVPVVLVGLVLDRLSKDLTILYLKDKDPIDLIPGVIRLTYCENRGAAFSLLEGQRWFFIVLTVIVLAYGEFVVVTEGNCGGAGSKPPSAIFRLRSVFPVQSATSSTV